LKNIKNLKKDVEILLWLFSDNEETEEEWQKEKVTYKPNSIEMVPIPAGTFTMGGFSTESISWDSERPRHQVTLSGFKMGRYEVTQEQYQSVMGKNPSHFYSNSRKGEIQEKRPVDSVSWYD
ncbi:formylglycine-generating enzyme family protein, partial [Treponema sp. R6D11]